MSPEENKAILRHALDEIWNKGNLAVADELAHPDLVARSNTLGMAASNTLAQMKGLVAMYRAAFPDLSVTFDEMVAEGEQVAVRFTATGTHLGPLLGIPPTGKRATVANITVYHMRDGRIMDQQGLTDTLGLLQQLGVAPQLGSVSR